MDIKRLQSLPLFQGVGDNDLEMLAGMFQSAEMMAGSSLAKQGDFAYKFFVVLEGTVEVYRDYKHIADLGPGEFFGEIGVLADARRNARVTAKTRVDLVWMMPWDFERMRSEIPDVGARIDAVVDERMADLRGK
ncbi:MAG: CRP/FNR family cyclic AMP-dependent transcriptional regulator [Candidatus Aldehydirespiratoraceae bacterium]|jgi:CRP/FNR family cyclic AMP-dependent transcriptional regulator